jgi:tyrosine-protein phosphatase SIW14
MTLPSTTPPLVPPINFSLVAPGVYRSGHPNKKNFGFLRRLKLRGIMYVEGTEEYRKDSMDFVEEEAVVLHRFDLSKEAVSGMPSRSDRSVGCPRVYHASTTPRSCHHILWFSSL